MPKTMADRARAILRGNDLGGYTVPTRNVYPFQWNWDSCLVALGWATFDEARAWAEIESLFSAQWDDGMVPHIVFHQPDPGYFPGPDVWRTGRTPATSGITQPPVAATMVAKLAEGVRDRATAKAALRRLLPKLHAWHRWFRTARDPKGLGLVAILHPWESGMDNSPVWDEALARVDTTGLEPYQRRDTGHVDPSQRPTQDQYDRFIALVQAFRDLNYDPRVLHDASPFRVADVGVNSILLRADRDLVRLADDCGERSIRSDCEAWIAAGERGLDELWDEAGGIYLSRDLTTGRPVPAATSAGFLPFYAGGLERGRVDRLAATLDRWLAEVRYGVPSFPASDPRFDRKRYWRGPVWAIVNYLIADGLLLHGDAGRARRLSADTEALIAGAGFWEYFDPTDGQGLGGPDFSWTAAMWLAWICRRGG